MNRTVTPGTYVTPKVRLVHPLGAGGMGEVWVADHLSLNTRVAVKVIKGLDHDANARARFEREATAAARIQSPHVVKISDYGVTETGQPFIIMELLSGQSLAERIGKGPLGLRELSSVLMQAASALATAHQAGVVHRDIKPPNIFLVDTPTGEPFVKVLDFGIAIVQRGPDASPTPSPSSAPLTATGALLGTPDYMSPEQLLTQADVTPRSDIWSLAVVAYEALSGTRPFAGTTVVALCMNICEARYDRERVPVMLRPWFERAFAVDPAARFGSVVEAAEAFRALAEAEITGARPVAATTLHSPQNTGATRKSGVSGGVIALLSVIALLMGGVVVWLVVPRSSSGTTKASADKSAKSSSKKKKKSSKSEASAEDKTATPVAPPPPPPAPPEPADPEPDPSATPTPRPTDPSQPLPQPVASECAKSCREVGACKYNGTSCLVASSADCAKSGGCKELGQCTKVGASCRAGSDSDCVSSSHCKSRGHCGLYGGAGGTCGPKSHAHCRASSTCAERGRCSLEGANCAPGSDADCRASARCASEGECKKNGMSCSK